MVVDCGGGTVDLTVHELDNDTGVLKELHKGTGGPCGATGKKTYRAPGNKPSLELILRTTQRYFFQV
jgi:hypothetical protein